MVEKDGGVELMDDQSEHTFEINRKALDLEGKKISLEETKTRLYKDLADKFIPLADKYLHEKTTYIEGPKLKLSFWIFGIMLFIIVVICGVLVFFDKLEGSNFTFLLGALIGSVMVILGDILIPKK